MMLLCGLLAAPSPHLQEGIRLYQAQNYSEALEALTRAIDEPNSSRDKARIHVYIGLIQFRFSMRDDASASFEQALDYDATLELPKKHAHPGARKLFAKIKRDRSGEERPQKRAVKKKTKRSKKNGNGNGDEPDAELEPEPDTPPPPPLPAESTIAMVPPPPPPPAGDGMKMTAPPPPPSLEPPPPPPDITGVVQPPEPGPNLPAWISMGAGAAATVAAAVLLGVSIHNLTTANDEPVAIDTFNKFRAGERQRTAAIVVGSVGIVGLGLGTTLFLLD